MSLLRFLGLEDKRAGREAEPTSLTELAAQLDELPAQESRFVAAYAYLLARIAGADLRTEVAEREAMAARLAESVDIDAERAKLLTDAAIRTAETYSASDDHLVARAFRDISDQAERLRLIRCLYAVAAADDIITTIEDNEIFEVATEIGVSRTDVVALRAEFRSHLGTMKALPRER